MDNKDAIIEQYTEQIADLTALVEALTEANAALNETIKRQQETIKELQETIKELQRQLKQNSQNSSKPPSSDGFKKPKRQSLREKSGKKQGGQKGHPGSHMEIPHEPDEIREHLPSRCLLCSHLNECIQRGDVFSCGEKRYEVNAVITTKVTEHRSVCVASCPCGEGSMAGNFPDDVRAYVQYGDSVSVLVGLLSTYGAMSVKRIHILLGSLLGVSLSTGTITSMVSKCAGKVGDTLEKIKSMLIGAKVAHFDETGTYVNGKIAWVHSSSTSELTYQTINAKRGLQGMEENGVLPNFHGIAVHDCWTPYWRYDRITHAVCNAHLLRELQGVVENSPNHTWPRRFRFLLFLMKQVRDTAIEKGKACVNEYGLHKLEEAYDHVMAVANIECPPPHDSLSGKRVRRGKERALIERLMALKDSVCLFFRDLSVPFDNNQAERDIRNVKTKTKVAGCFRSEKGAQDYLSVMSYISTGRKHGVSAYEALTAAFAGNAEIVLT